MKNKTNSKLITGVFLAFTFVIAILYIALPKSDFSETEKRYLAKFPRFSIENLASGKFTSGFEDYLTDHTPFRNFFVSVNSYFELAKGNNGSNGVYLGSDGWLIEKPFDRKNRFAMNMKRLNSFAKETGIPAYLTVIPEKGYIYGEKLPKNALDYQDGEYLNRIPALCGKDMQFIDISKPLLEEKNNNQLFYKTDHHWTSRGAYVGYREICDKMNLTAASEDSFDSEITENFFGTSYSTSLYTKTKPDSIEVMRSRKSGGKAEVSIEDREKIQSENMFFTDALSESDKYVVFLDGNHPLVNIKTGNEGGRLLVIKDSFAHCLVPFLAENYSEITMIDLRYYKKPVSQLISSEGFEQILFVYGMENLAESKDIILR